jgi:F0F1-type ATP synthase assembly protein I
MPRPGPLVRYGRYGALAFEFSGTIAGGVVVGWLIDRSFGTDPYAVVCCTLLAVVGGFVRMIQVLRRFDRLELDGES